MKLLAAILLAAVLCSAADYPVAGVVINAQTGAPLPHAQVYLFGRSPKPVASMTTGDDGRFNLDVPEGTYRLVAGTRVHAHSYGSKNPDEGFGSAVIAGPTHNTTNLTFRWYPTAAIFGKVVDDSGEPVENALVQLLRSSVLAGRRVTATVNFVRTNDLGEYRFASLPGGAHYYVGVSGRPWYSAANNPFVQTEQRQVAFVPLYYPNTPDPGRAAPLTPKPGEEVRADFTLTSAAGATVTVKHNLPAGKQAVVNLMSAGVAGNQSFLDPQPFLDLPGMPAHDTNFADVPPGHYTVRVTTGASGGSNVEGSAEIDVNGSDITVDVAMHPSPSLSGTVRFQNPNARPRGSVLVGLGNEQGIVVFNAAVHPDGTFLFPGVLAGKYHPVLRAAGFFATATEVSGAPYRNGYLDLSAGDSPTVTITASDEVGEVKGFVTKGDQPADAVLAALATATSSDDPGFYHGYQTESDGSFDFKNIPAGRYFLFAVDDTALEYANPAAIRPYLAGAKSITIEAHGSSTERIPISSPARQ